MAMGVQDQRAVRKTLIMGVLNLTPDSFYPPSTAMDPVEALTRAREMVQQGADILDIGGESSRPGSDPVDAAEELARVVPLLDAAQGESWKLPIDTYRAETARAALARGAAIVNDITALRGDPEMAGVVAEYDADCVLMHMQGDPKTMQDNPQYEDVVDEVSRFFEERIEYATRAGIREDNLWLDPGFGFGKTVAQNLTLLRRIAEFKRFGLRLLIGTSNKSTIGAVLNLPIEERGEGNAASVAVAICRGVDCVRVHDVKSMARVARMCDAILGREIDG